jgi:hypothetical protein
VPETPGWRERSGTSGHSGWLSLSAGLS